MPLELKNINGKNNLFLLINQSEKGQFLLLNSKSIPPSPAETYLLLAENNDFLLAENEDNLEKQH